MDCVVHSAVCAFYVKNVLENEAVWKEKWHDCNKY